MEPMLRLEAVSYAYPGRDAALDGLTAGIGQGVTLLAGPNAGGKTTLLRVLAGLLPPRAGRIVDAASGAGLDAAALRSMSRMVMQDADPQILGPSVGEDIMLGRAASELRADFAGEALRLLDRFGMAALWHEPVDALSYGQKRKLCLIHALLAGPRLLLMDEPFAGLDYPAARELRAFIRANRDAGLPQVVSTHELEPVYDVADWVVVVRDGVVAAEGEPEALRTRLGEWSVRPPGGGWD